MVSTDDVLRGNETVPEDTATEKLRDVNETLDAVRTFTTHKTRDGSLNGLPISVKDNICVKNTQCTAGSNILEEYVPTFDATPVKKIKDAGGFICAKTNMDEFGFGTFSTNSAYETPKNPYDTNRVTGGSSGGAAALTAASPVPHAALGQSTGGSISAPAAFCGVVGVTPTYGLVSRYGLIDYANSLDRIGPITRTVPAAATLLDVIAGEDPHDFTTQKQRGNYRKRLNPDLSQVSIGVVSDAFMLDGVDEAVASTVRDGVDVLDEHGARVTEESFPYIFDVVTAAYYIIATAEASTNLAKFSGLRYGLQTEPEEKGFNEYFSSIRGKGFGDEAKRRILLGTFARKAGYRDKYYMKALKVRRKIIDAYKHLLGDNDVLVTPTMPITAPTFSEAEDMEPVDVYAMDALTIGPNLAGLPHASIPVGFVDGLPVGIHIIGDHFAEQKVLNAAHGLEQVLDIDTQVSLE